MSSEHKSPSILLLGASTGKVGVPAVHALAALGANLHVLVRDEEKAKKALAPAKLDGVKFLKGDVDDIPSVEKALHGIDRVFFISPYADVRQATAVAKAAKAAGVKLYIDMSVYGASLGSQRNTFSHNHARIEDAVDSLGLPWVFLRPSFFFQNWLGEAAGIKHGHAFYRPQSNNPSTQIDTRDIADAAATILTAADVSKYIGRTYNLSGGAEANVSHEATAKIFSEKLGKEVKAVIVDDNGWYHALQQNGIPEYVAWLLLKLQQGLREGSLSYVYGDYKILTGKEPRKLADFVAENKAAFV